ncbi:hypothetical protein JCM8208_006826 [Rhodotorula glutinis]
MEDQQHTEARSATPSPTAQDEPARSSSPSPTPLSASSQTTAHAVEHPQQASTTSSDTHRRSSVADAPFSQHDFPVLCSAPLVQPGFDTKRDDDPQYSTASNVHMVDGRATFVLPTQRTTTAALPAPTASGAASLTQHGADRSEQPSFSWYDPGAAQGPVGQRVQPRAAPAHLALSTEYLGLSNTQGGRRPSDPATDHGANAPRENGSSVGNSSKNDENPIARAPELGRIVASVGRKRSRDEQHQQQPDIAVDSAAAPGHNQHHHLSVGLSVRLSSGEMNDASSATTDDEAVEVQQREAQRRRVESNEEQQQALAIVQGQQEYYARLQQLYHQQQYQQQQRTVYNPHGVPPSSAARAHPAQPYPSAPPFYGQQSYQPAYPTYQTSFSAQSSAQSGEVSSSSCSSSATSPQLGAAQVGPPPRFNYYPATAPQGFYPPQYAASTAASHSAYSPSTAITSPSVQATPASSERRVSGPPLLPAFGAAPQQQQQQKQPPVVSEKQAFGAASSPQVAQQTVAAEADKPFKRGVKVNNPYTIPTAQGVKPFVNKLRFLMRNPDKVGDVICWDESGTVILVNMAQERLESEVLPRTFGHSNVQNLKNQFTTYGFLGLKDPALSRALNPPRSSSSTAGPSTSTASSSSPHELRNVSEWKAYLHTHTADELAVVRAEERKRAAIIRSAERDKEAAKRVKAAEKSEGEGLSGMLAAAASASAQQGELSGDSSGEEETDEEDGDDEPWFSRDEIDNVRLLRRVRAKSSKAKPKAGGGGATAGAGGGGGTTGTPTGSSAGSSSTALGSNMSSTAVPVQATAPRPTSTAAHSTASTSGFPLPPPHYPAIPLRSSANASSSHTSTAPAVPPPQVQPQASTSAQSQARDAGSADRFDSGALLAMRRAMAGAGQEQ